ncbi:MAG: caspase family protein [Hydrococcus sp. CRU_1_1]|nr:caspase family protein [Hydrococcus sp. CRU_1_1]
MYFGSNRSGNFYLRRKSTTHPRSENYRRTLAQTTNRKLALLVGIDRYPQNRQLNGCVTDVELQRELLIARFGFKPQDIYYSVQSTSYQRKHRKCFYRTPQRTSQSR